MVPWEGPSYPCSMHEYRCHSSTYTEVILVHNNKSARGLGIQSSDSHRGTYFTLMHTPAPQYARRYNVVAGVSSSSITDIKFIMVLRLHAYLHSKPHSTKE